MTTRTDAFDLASMRLSPGEGRQLDLGLVIEPFELGGHTYAVTPVASRDAPGAPLPEQIPARLDVSRMVGQGYALHVKFKAALHGPCMRCLEPASPQFTVDAREVSQPGEGAELESPYLIESILDLDAWARDALALALPPALLCRSDCPGLCPICGADLNATGPEHGHASEPDPRWAALSDLELEDVDARVEATRDGG